MPRMTEEQKNNKMNKEKEYWSQERRVFVHTYTEHTKHTHTDC